MNSKMLVIASIAVIALFAGTLFVFMHLWGGLISNYTELAAATGRRWGINCASCAPIDSLKTPTISEQTILSLKNSYIAEKKKFVLVDLRAMTLTLYGENGTSTEFKVLTKGRDGSWWETTSGNYSVVTKETNHFSSVGKVWQPWSIQFYGNFFIHGWPYYPGGSPVPQGYSGGCIRLGTDDAKKVFVFAEKDTPIVISSASSSASADLVVHSAGETSQSFYYVANRAAPPRISADAYLVADLDSGDILMERNSGKMYAIASITKLITALTSLDAVNQYQAARVSVRAGATHGDFGGLKVGETLTVGTLLYPLLMESSNDAAEVIAEHYGRDRFLSLMNKKAEPIGLLNTHFGDPSGLSPENVSTAQALFTLAQYIYRKKSFVLETTKMAVKKVEAEVPGSRTHTWYNNNYFVVRGDPKYLGGKNGYTDEA